MNKRTFVKLQLLVDVTYEDETAEDNAAWISNVRSSGVADGYTYSGEEEYDTADFACNEMEFADVQVYDFMGGHNEAERFYVRDIVVFKHIATGDFYVLEHDDLGVF
jgi:hypothetical protein